MTDLPVPARILRALTADHHVRLAAMDAGPLWDGVRRGHPNLDAGACEPLVEIMGAALLLQSRVLFEERQQLLLKASGRARAMVADAWPDGGVRCMLDLAPGNLAGVPWLRPPGTLQVMRSNPAGKPYIGALAMVEGSLSAQIEAYLQQSEQVEASVTLWCDASTGAGGGLLVEPLPDCPPERMKPLVAALEGLEVVPLWERTPEFLVAWINRGEGAEILSATEVHYRCRCSREALVATLNGFGPDKVRDLFEAGESLEIRCDYCCKSYRIAAEDLAGGGGAP